MTMSVQHFLRPDHGVAHPPRCLEELFWSSSLCPSVHDRTLTNDWVRSKINALVGPQEHPPASLPQRQKLAWFGHVTRRDSLTNPPKTTTTTTTAKNNKNKQTNKKQQQPTTTTTKTHPSRYLGWWATPWVWTSPPTPELLTMASCRKDWKRISAESSLMSPPTPRRPNGSKGLN